MNDSVSWSCCALESKKFDVTVNLKLKGKQKEHSCNYGLWFFLNTFFFFFLVIKASFNGSYFAVLQNTQVHRSLCSFLEIPSAPKQSTPYSIPCTLILKQSDSGSLQFNASSQHGALSSLFLICVSSPSRLHKISLFLWFLVFIKLWKHKMSQCFILTSAAIPRIL